MKKIFNLALLTLGCLLVFSCSNDDYVEKVSSVQVIDASTLIDAAGGTETITVNLQGVTATAADSWLSTSVSGNVITLTAEPNTSRETRHTSVTIKAANGDQQVVSVSQMGLLLVLAERKVELSDDAESASVAVEHTNGGITVNSLAPWITATFNSATSKVEIKTEANNSGLGRQGQVEVKCQNYTEILTVEQFDFQKDVLGDYYFYYSRSATQAQWASLVATLTEESLILHIGTTDFTIPITMPNQQASPYVVEVANEPFIGKYGDYFCYLGFDAYKYNLLTRYPQYFFAYLSESSSKVTLALNDYGDGEIYFDGQFEGTIVLDGDDLDAMTTWHILAMAEQTYAQATFLGPLLTMHYPQIEKITAGEETASPRRAPRHQPETLQYILKPGK